MDPLLHHGAALLEKGQFTPGTGMGLVCAQPRGEQQPPCWTRRCSARAGSLQGSGRGEQEQSPRRPRLQAAFPALLLGLRLPSPGCGPGLSFASRAASASHPSVPFSLSTGSAAPTNSDPSHWSFPGQCVTPLSVLRKSRQA